MIFSSFEFLFVFLPACLVAVLAARRFGTPAVVFTTLLFSLLFYGYFRPSYLLLLAGSISVNFVGGEILRRRPHRMTLAALIAFNLGLLGIFKYLDFLLDTLDLVIPGDLPRYGIMLPLAISFFTFQQIAYVCDCYRGHTVANTFSQYALLVAFFPHLIAGPIVRQQEVMPDIVGGRMYPSLGRIGYGLSIVGLGLFKKVFFADHLAEIADPVFEANASGQALAKADAWTGLVAFALQIYFDFSAYSDMAIGLAAMFGLRFPVNFLSPYRARSIIDFWRRWHITLSSFLRDYFYLALGGNRRGVARHYGNILVVMLFGGLWHGADWAFVLWGGLHGALIVLNHALRRIFGRTGSPRAARIARVLGQPVTFIAVCLTWVPFRATGLEWVAYYEALLSGPGGPGQFAGDADLALLGLGLLVVWTFPNLAQVFGYGPGPTASRAVEIRPTKLCWTPTWGWAGFTALVWLAALYLVLREPANAFIYFQF